MKSVVNVLLAIGALHLWAVPVRAQSSEPDLSRVRLRFGPLLVNPTIALTNAGVDTNVFNQAESDRPKSDFTMTVTPQADVWLRLGRTWLAANVREDVVWYKTYSSERSVNNNYTVGWLVPLTRFTFTANGNWINARERPGYEIDARSDRSERGVNATADARVLSKTFFGVRGDIRKVEFDRDAVFLGTNLHDELTRTQTSAAVTVRHELTPLTSLTVDVGRQQDRFDFSPLRDSDSTYVTLGVRFDSRALISGSAKVGLRDFQLRSLGVEDYRGSTAAVDLSYVALGSTRLGLNMARDVQYSFNADQPYYLQTGFTGSLSQHIYGPLDVEARAGIQRLAYRSREGVIVARSNRVDRVHTYGGGVGYRVGRDLRVGFSVDRQQRQSGLDLRNYAGLRFGMAMTYAR